MSAGREHRYGITAICGPDSGMSLDGYQQLARKTAIYPHDHQVPYLALALSGEAGEVADKVKKVIRDKEGHFFKPDAQAIADELGDVLWYLANAAHVLGYKLSEIAQFNIEKINSRLERGTLHGSGDERYKPKEHNDMMQRLVKSIAQMCMEMALAAMWSVLLIVEIRMEDWGFATLCVVGLLFTLHATCMSYRNTMGIAKDLDELR